MITLLVIYFLTSHHNNIVSSSSQSPCIFIEKTSLECSSHYKSSQSNERHFNESQLRVHCSDAFVFDSSIVNNTHFGFFPSLIDLEIQYCQITNLSPHFFSGLPHLKSLSYQSFQYESSRGFLEIDSRPLFSDLKELENLNLSHNHLSKLNPGLLDSFSASLISLNLSHNSLTSITDLYLNSGSLSSLTVLDLSYNQLNALLSLDLPKSLERLNLEYNDIFSLEASNFEKLLVLNLGHNNLGTLTGGTLRGAFSLTSLFLQNNSLTHLSPGVFIDCVSLTLLNLSSNSLSSHLLSQESFEGLHNLSILDLSYNQMSSIENGVIFNQLSRLTHLNLKGNHIHSLNPEEFHGLIHLKVLDLSFNLIQVVNQNSFPSTLVKLSLEGNKLYAFPSVYLSNQTLPCHLKELNLGKNLLSEIPSFLSFGCEVSLSILDLSHNSISQISQTDFASLKDLQTLELSYNRLKRLNGDSFGNLTSLEILNLNGNSISDIAPETLSNLTELKALRLDSNQLSDLNGVVSSLPQLSVLNVSFNHLSWFDYGFIPRSLETLNMKNNLLGEMGNYFNLKDGFSLRTLDISYNKLKVLSKESFPLSSLQTIILNHNEIHQLAPLTFTYQLHLQTVEMTHNQLKTLKLSSLSTASKYQNLPSITLSQNPFVCDCSMDWLQDINEISLLSQQHFKVQDLEELSCSLGKKTKNQTLKSFQVLSVPLNEFLCSYTTHCFALCLCCDYFACDCRMQCPEGCNCYHDSNWNRNVIQCSHSHRTDIPLLIPMDASEVFLDGNRIESLNSQSFHGRHKVRLLLLNNSRIETIENQTLHGLINLRELHLEYNSLRELKGNEFENLGALESLYLDHNALQYISKTTFDSLNSLSKLTLSNNLLSAFPFWNFLEQHSHLSQISLSFNPWSCSCDFVLSLSPFLQAFPSESQVICVKEKGNEEFFSFDNNHKILNERVSECSAEVFANTHSQRSSDGFFDWTPILIPILITLFLLLLSSGLVIYFKKQLRGILNRQSKEMYESSRTSSSLLSESPSVSYVKSSSLFDIYVSHTNENKDFVYQTLAPLLEKSDNNTAYRLCVHQRDFPPTASLYDTVSLAAESSSKILIVLSAAYLQIEWPLVKNPLRHALAIHQQHHNLNETQRQYLHHHHQEGQKHRSSGEKKVIFLLLEDLNEPDIDYELAQYMRAYPVIKWGSPGFINKLKYFLPEPPLLTFQRHVNLRALTPPNNYLVSSEETLYQSIPPPQHVYHTLDEISHYYYNKNVDVLTTTTTNNASASSSASSPQHCHSISASSHQFLIPTELDEYIV